ncbi:MAG: sodium:alanine symporter family protein, partial [Gammaproteobacteria bacterium]
MHLLQSLIHWINSVLWGERLGIPLLIPLLAFVGIYLTLGLRAMPWRYLPRAFGLLWRGRKTTTYEGDNAAYQPLMTALSPTIGTGNLAGGATA